MEFTPIGTQKETQELSKELFPEGEYEFRVAWAKAEISKQSHNDMITLSLHIFRNGEYIQVYDYLLEAMMFKLKHFCEATGLEKEYASGTLTPGMCMGKSGRCKLIIQHDKSGKWKDRNSIDDYCTEEEVQF